MKKLARLLALTSAGLSALLFLRLQMPGGFLALPFKLLAGALSPFVSLAGAVAAALGLLLRAPLATLAGLFAAGASGRYLQRILSREDPFTQAFGRSWQALLSDQVRSQWLSKRWNLGLPATEGVRQEKDIPFWTVPQTGRQILCDLWLPPIEILPTGLALVFLHGSDWYLLDKDTGTSPFFRHLAAQGHIIMDVAYGLFPEHDMGEMVADARRAVAWLKANARPFGVNPEHIVLGGASAGGQLALLAAYAPEYTAWSPPDLSNQDTRVSGVLALYGPTDLQATYFHTNQQHTTQPAEEQRSPESFYVDEETQTTLESIFGAQAARLGFNKRSEAGAFVHLLGGRPQDVPEKYAQFSPMFHVHPDSPPTLLVQGEDDLITPVTTTRALALKLQGLKVPVVLDILPQTDHGFDLLFPQVSPPAQAALWDIERFLALILNSHSSAS